MSSLITDIDEAKRELTEVLLDVEADQGADKVEAAYGDLVELVGDRCDPETRAELFRREGVERP